MLGTYNRLGVPVWASNLTVIRAARRKLRDPRNKSERVARKRFYRQMLEQHVGARELYDFVQRGGY